VDADHNTGSHVVMCTQQSLHCIDAIPCSCPAACCLIGYCVALNICLCCINVGMPMPCHKCMSCILHCFPSQVWDVKDAGLQAASRVAAASDPLALLAEISQNFPSIVSSLTRQQVRGRQLPYAARVICSCSWLLWCVQQQMQALNVLLVSCAACSCGVNNSRCRALIVACSAGLQQDARHEP
jgi:hypothetical protein